MGKQLLGLLVFSTFTAGLGLGATHGGGILFYAFYVFFSLVFMGTGFGGIIARRRLADQAMMKISTAPQGLTGFEGFAWATEYLLDPEDDLYAAINWKVCKEEHHNKKKRSIELAKGNYPEQFIFHDGTAAVLIENKLADQESGPFLWRDMSDDQKACVLKWVGKESEIAQTLSNQQGHYGIYWAGRKLGEPVIAQGGFSSLSKPKVDVLGGFTQYLEKFNELKSNPLVLDKNKDRKVNVEEMVKGHEKFAKEIAKQAFSRNTPLELVQTEGWLGPHQNRQVSFMSSDKKTIMAENTLPFLWIWGLLGTAFMAYAVVLLWSWIK